MLYDFLHNNGLRLGLAFLTALVVSLVVGSWLIRFFHRKNVIEDTTQPDHAGLNAIQSQKKNVPTMGGLMILAAIITTTLIWNDLRSPYVLIGFLVLVVLGGAGFVDDYIKLKYKPARGLTKTQKLAIQFVLGGIVGCLLLRQSNDIPGLLMPFTGWQHAGLWFIAWCGFFLAATSNAINLTDGLDGLAGGLTLIAAIALIFMPVFAYRHEGAKYDRAANMTTLCASTAGAVLGFLRYNYNPARIFMGDTGSLALGGLLAYVALTIKSEFLFLVIGGVFFIEELTVAMQIVSFKLTKKRIFPITPIHHYFQVNLKWPEQKIVSRAWILGVIFAVLAAVIVMAT